ncbi:MAG: glycosyl transferase [Candidatus Aminicenantes bacterium]|nr:glycosyl transferase [Candidatus Aminicenantes bacterium]
MPLPRGNTVPMNEQPANDIRLSVVIPTYNKVPRIAATLDAVGSYLSKKPYASEIVVVDDGSTDGTADAARTALAALAGRIGSRVIRREKNRGKGASVKEGVLASAGAIVLFTDDDLSTPIEECDKLLAALEAGADAAIGSRALAASEIRVRQRRPREGMGKMFNRLVRWLVLEGYPDTQCGFKAFRREPARAVFSRIVTAGFAFDVEVLVLCRELGYRVAQIPVVWSDVRPSRVRILRGSWRMLRELGRIRRVYGSARRGA